QVPQLSTPLQPSDMVPHVAFTPAHVLAVQGARPHRFGPAPPQVCEPGQVPQFKTPPQPSGSDPQFAEALAHVRAAHGAPSGRIAAPSGKVPAASRNTVPPSTRKTRSEERSVRPHSTTSRPQPTTSQLPRPRQQGTPLDIVTLLKVHLPWTRM